MINKLDQNELSNLSINDLSIRMDNILLEHVNERYGSIISKDILDFKPSVSKILNTNTVKKMTDCNKRKLCYLTFNTLLQMEYTNFTFGASNLYIHNKTKNDNKWQSATTQIRNAAITQFGIISSRISMECFMELLYFLGEKKRIETKN